MVSGYLPDDKFDQVVRDVFLSVNETKSGVELCHSNAVALSICCKHHSEKIMNHKDSQKIAASVRSLAVSKNILLSQAGMSCCVYLFHSLLRVASDAYNNKEEGGDVCDQPQQTPVPNDRAVAELCEAVKTCSAAQSMDVRQWLSSCLDSLAHQSASNFILLDNVSSHQATLEVFIANTLLSLMDDPNSMVKFNAETSLCRLFRLHTDEPRMPQECEQFLKLRDKLTPLCAKMKHKFKTRSLDAPADIDVSSLNM